MKTIAKYWFLEDFNLFKKLGKLNMMNMSDVLEMGTINKGQIITLNNDHNQDDRVYFLKKGTVKIVDLKSNTVKHIVKRGNVFGELSLYQKETAANEVVYALEDCVICYLNSEQMELLMEKHKSLKNGILKIYGLRIQKLERRLHDLLYKDSTTRIKEFIIDYVNEFGEYDELGILKAKNLLSHKEIGNLTNTSRQTVSNVLSTMRKKGTINYNTESIFIDNKQLNIK